MADLDASDIILSIRNGDQDLDLPALASAIQDRLRGDKLRERWWVHFDGRYITPDTMNITGARLFEQQTNVRWEFADPAVSMVQRAALVLAHLVEKEGWQLDAAVNVLKGHNADDITFGTTIQVSPPKDEASTS